MEDVVLEKYESLFLLENKVYANICVMFLVE